MRLRVSGTTLAGMSLGMRSGTLLAQAPRRAPQAVPETLVDTTLRTIAPLPLNPDGSAPEHPASAAGPITEPDMWRYTKAMPPEIETTPEAENQSRHARHGEARRTLTLRRPRAAAPHLE